MAIYEVFRVEVVNSVVVTDPEPWIIATPPDSVDPSAGFNLTPTINGLSQEVVDQTNWHAATGGAGGTNHNGGDSTYLWDGLTASPNGPYDGYLYFVTNDGTVDNGSDVEALIDGLPRTFELVLEDFVVCFARGTRIATPEGEIVIEELAVGDQVLNARGEAVTIRWIGSRTVGFLFAEHLRPVRIAANALGPGRPHRDLVVSPEHRLVVGNAATELMFGTPSMLVAARELVNDSTIRRCTDLVEVEYYHMLFDRHEIITAEGLESESFYPDPKAVASLSAAQRRELEDLFPELLDADAFAEGHAVPVLRPAEAALLGRFDA